MSNKLQLEKFGEMLISEVYDAACGEMQRTVLRPLRGVRPNPIHEKYSALDEGTAVFVRKLIEDSVSQTFAQFLQFIDVHQIPLLIKTDVGETVDVRRLSDGLAAEPYNDWGWIAKFSKFKDGIGSTEQE